MEQSTFSECQPWKFHSMEPMTLSTIKEGVPDVEQAVPPERQKIVLSSPSLELLVRKSIDAFFDNDLFLATRLFMDLLVSWLRQNSR
jgi:hypothetical protein